MLLLRYYIVGMARRLMYGVLVAGAVSAAGKLIRGGGGDDEATASPIRSRLPPVGSLNLLSDTWDFHFDHFLPAELVSLFDAMKLALEVMDNIEDTIINFHFEAEKVCKMLRKLIVMVEMNKECFTMLKKEITSMISLEVCT